MLQPHFKYTLKFYILVYHVHDLLLQHYFTQVYIFFPVPVKELYQTESYSLYVMQLIHI